MKYIIFDISNILYRTFYANKSEDDITLAGLAQHSALLTIQKYYKLFTPHKIVMAFDRSSWRKEYTKSDMCISPRQYKGNRRKTMTPAERAKYEKFIGHLNDFEELMRKQTTIISLAGDGLEADDLIAGAVQVLSLDDTNEMIVVTADKDMIQLLGYPNVRLIDPATGMDRTLDEWNGDVNLFMFEKCMRGDLGDNVQSALPRVRKTRIHKAYTDEFERANMMNETWTDQNGKEYVVKNLFKENQLLMDLSKQPEDIQLQIVTEVLDSMENPGTFSYFHFMKFLGRFELKKLAENADQFVDMLSR